MRLTARQQAVLESVAHLEHTTPSSYAHQVLVDHLARLLSNPRVQADIENREAYSKDAADTIRLPAIDSGPGKVDAATTEGQSRRARST
jgi:hypothetical protein